MKLTDILQQIALALFLTVNPVLMDDCCENICQPTSEPLSVSEVRSSALAVVPYDQKTLVVPDFYQDERRLQFGDFMVTISQNWRDVGVAAVVWDAVSFITCN